jgi:hypothetical protein
VRLKWTALWRGSHNGFLPANRRSIRPIRTELASDVEQYFVTRVPVAILCGLNCARGMSGLEKLTGKSGTIGDFRL